MHHEKNRLRLIEALYPFFAAAAAAAISFLIAVGFPENYMEFRIDFKLTRYMLHRLVRSYRVFYGFVGSKKRVYVMGTYSVGGGVRGSLR